MPPSGGRSLSLVVLALAVAVIVGHARVLAGGRTWDDVRYHADVAPPRLAAAHAIQSGELPAWWDGTGLGVPLAAEPSHGALYPPTWLAASPRSFDWLQLLHLAWAALGVAVWSRGRLRDRGPAVDTNADTDGPRGAAGSPEVLGTYGRGLAERAGRGSGSRDHGALGAASDQGALVAGVLVAMSGLLASTALRGALPALAHLPWIAVATTALVNADDARARARAAVALAALLGLVALTGVFGALLDALVLAVALGAPALRGGIARSAPTIVVEQRTRHDEAVGEKAHGDRPHLSHPSDDDDVADEHSGVGEKTGARPGFSRPAFGPRGVDEDAGAKTGARPRFSRPRHVADVGENGDRPRFSRPPVRTRRVDDGEETGAGPRLSSGGIAFAVAVVAGLAIGAVQWMPALLQLGRGAGSSVHALPFARLVELIVPGSFGATEPGRAVSAVAGAAAWAPSLFVGAPLLALALVRRPPRRVVGVLGAFGLLVLVAGRGAWPAWLGAPELHLGALVLVLAALAGTGVDELIAGRHRAVRALAAAAACTLAALLALGVMRGKHPESATAIGRALVEGGLGLACTLGALAMAWRGGRGARDDRDGDDGRGARGARDDRDGGDERDGGAGAGGAALPKAIVLALLVLPSVASLPAAAPTVPRDVVTEAPPFVVALEQAPRPLRAYRMATRQVSAIDAPETVADAIATFAGGSAWRWGITGARSEDPARPVDHDRTWRAAASEGGALLDRFGIGIAILPTSVADSRRQRGMTLLARRGDVALVSIPVAPIASVMRSWQWAAAPEDALALMFSIGGGVNVQRGTVVLSGAGATSAPGARAPEPCAIERWSEGDIALRCHASAPGYAVVSSTPSPGWRATVDGAPAPWLTADVLRRAVAVPAGEHDVRWIYATPGLPLGLLLASLGVLALGVLVVVAHRRAAPADDATTN